MFRQCLCRGDVEVCAPQTIPKAIQDITHSTDLNVVASTCIQLKLKDIISNVSNETSDWNRLGLGLRLENLLRVNSTQVDLCSKCGQKFKSTRLGEVRVDSESTQAGSVPNTIKTSCATVCPNVNGLMKTLRHQVYG